MHNHPSSGGAIVVGFLGIAACMQAGTPHRDGGPGPDLPAAGSFCLNPTALDAGLPVAFQVNGCRHTPDGGAMQAVFAWRNGTGNEQSAPYGPANHVSPGPAAQGQPASFGVGAGDKFAVPFGGSETSWTILGQSVTVSPASPECAAICLLDIPLGCLDCGDQVTDLCTQVCGDGLCDQQETCASCPADCTCSSLMPLVDCVIPLDGGRKLVSFGYSNGASTGSGLQVGLQNQVVPGQAARGQPVHFEPGDHHSVFQVTYAGSDLTWVLGGHAVTVPPDAPICSQSCPSACPKGTTCVSDSCEGSCGDGLCVESCGSCPDDCGCAPPSVCVGGSGCGNPPSCSHDGVGMECGTSDTFGVHVDCGPCPDGQGCSWNHFCEPLCPI